MIQPYSVYQIHPNNRYANDPNVNSNYNSNTLNSIDSNKKPQNKDALSPPPPYNQVMLRMEREKHLNKNGPAPVAS